MPYPRSSFLIAAVVVATGCSDGKSAARSRGSVAEAPATPPTPTSRDAAPPKAQDAGTDTADAPAPAPPALPGTDFIAEAVLLYRVAACAGDDPIPVHLPAKIVDAHCARLEKRKNQYRDRYGTMAKEFIAGLRPEGLPEVVVYPFGGGDLISALVAYPDAKELTTLSLEHAGDPRRIRAGTADGATGKDGPRSLTAVQLRDSLAALSLEIGGMLSVSNNTSKNLSSAHTNPLPAQLSSFLIGLAVHGFEPVSVRYFRIEDDGSLHYYTEAEIAELDDKTARTLKHDWERPNFSPAFSNVELQFRPRGAPDAPVRVHRHIAANLGDRQLAKTPGVMAHLNAKGRISAMTKAASYLLWRADFSTIRGYLLAHMNFMISDSTGIPPYFAQKAGFVQETYGRFESAFLNAPERHNEAFRELWQRQKQRRLRFRFGYVDSMLQPHLLVTKLAAKK